MGFEVNTILEDIVDKAMFILNSEVGSLMLLDKENNQLTIKVLKGLPAKFVNTVKVKVGEGISGWVAANRKSILCKDVRKDPRFRKNPHERYYTHSLISAPLRVNGELLGVININNKNDKSVFNQQDLRILEMLGTQAALALNRAQLYSKLEKSYINIVSLLINIIETKDVYTFAHSERVARFAESIAKKLHLTKKELKNIIIAARLHDLGKVVIADTMLSKKGPLTEEEWQKMRLHPQIGYKLLKPLDILMGGITTIVFQHHERYDGKGYPQGISADKISLGAKIISVADAFESMTSNKPYRDALPNREAIAELKRERGKQFDPKIIDVFLSCI